MAISFSFGASRAKISVLMVCTANICRSPLAQGLLIRAVDEVGLQKQIAVDSAGTQAGMQGQRPDPRAQAVASEVGVDISRFKARKLTSKDIERFDYVVAMDTEHLSTLQDMCPPEQQHKLALIMTYAPQNAGMEIPDPYFGNAAGFQRVLELLSEATQGLLDQIMETHFPEAKSL
jgi:protein-tyrosine phosphatase